MHRKLHTGDKMHEKEVKKPHQAALDLEANNAPITRNGEAIFGTTERNQDREWSVLHNERPYDEVPLLE